MNQFYNSVDFLVRQNFKLKIFDIKKSVFLFSENVKNLTKNVQLKKHPISIMQSFSWYNNRIIRNVFEKKSKWSNFSNKTHFNSTKKSSILKNSINMNKNNQIIKLENNFLDCLIPIVKKSLSILTKSNKNDENKVKFDLKYKIEKLIQNQNFEKKHKNFQELIFHTKSCIFVNSFQKNDQIIGNTIHSENISFSNDFEDSFFQLTNNFDCLEKLDEKSFKLQKYSSISLKGNLFKSFSPNLVFDHLLEIDLSENNLSDFKANFPKLKILNLSKNKLSKIDISAFKSSIVSINIAFNFFQNIDEMINSCPFLENLDCSHNKLLNVTFNSKNRLQNLNLGFNELQFINNLQEVVFIKNLNLTNNKFHKIDRIYAFPFLEIIDLEGFSNNHLETEIYCLKGYEVLTFLNTKITFRPICLLDFSHILCDSFFNLMIIQRFNDIVCQKVNNRFSKWFYISPKPYRKMIEIIETKQNLEKIEKMIEKSRFENLAKKRFFVFKKLIKNKIINFRKCKKLFELKNCSSIKLNAVLNVFWKKFVFKTAFNNISIFGHFRFLKAVFIQKRIREFIARKKVQESKNKQLIDKRKQFLELEVFSIEETDFFCDSKTFDNFEKSIFDYSENKNCLKNDIDQNSVKLIDKVNVQNCEVINIKDENDQNLSNQNIDKLLKTLKKNTEFECQESPVMKMLNNKIDVGSSVVFSPESVKNESKITNECAFQNKIKKKNEKILEIVEEWGFKNDETRKHFEMKMAKDRKRKLMNKKLSAEEKYQLLLKHSQKLNK